MADETDVLLKLCEQQWLEAKQAEDQRAAFTNIVVLVSGASFALMSQTGLTTYSILLCLMVVFFCILGFLTSIKLYERHQFHIARLRGWRAVLRSLKDEAAISSAKRKAVFRHKKKFRYNKKFRKKKWLDVYRWKLNRMWLWLYGLIAIVAIGAAVLALVTPTDRAAPPGDDNSITLPADASPVD